MWGFLLTATFTLFSVHANKMKAIAFSRSPGFHHWNSFWICHLVFVGGRTENTVLLPGNYLLNRISSVQLMFKEIKINEWLQIRNQHFTTYICAGGFLYTRCKDATLNFCSLRIIEWVFCWETESLILSVSLVMGRDFFVYSATVIMFHMWLGLPA